MGSQTQLPGSSSGPGSLTAYSTISREPGSTCTLRSNCPGARISSSSAPSWTSAQVPRALTLVSTRLRSPTPVARVCISPSPFCTDSSWSLTSLNDSPRRFSSVDWSFSSTVVRICSSFFSLPACSSMTRVSMVVRMPSSAVWLEALSSASRLETPSSCARCTSAMPPSVSASMRLPAARPRASSSRDARDERSASSRAARSSARTASAPPCAPAPERTSRTTSSTALTTASSSTSHRMESVMPGPPGCRRGRPNRNGGHRERC